MKIKRIKLHNIRSYIGAEIEFPEGSTVLAGDIGTGKTSVLLAIEFALFGLQPGQKGGSLLRNRTNEGSVTLELDVDGNIIIIERGLQRKKSINQSYARISINNEKKEMSVSELKNKILEILQYPKEFAKKTNFLYRFTVYTPQEEMKQIIIETPDIRLNTLRYIFGIDKYRRIRENAQFFTISLRENIRLYEGQIGDMEDIRKKLFREKENVENLKKNLSKLFDELKLRQQERLKLEKELMETEKKIKEKENYKTEAEKTNIMLVGKKELIQNIEKEIFNLNEQIKKIRKTKFEEKELQEKEQQLKEKEEISDYKSKIYFDILSKLNSSKTKIFDSEKLREQILKIDLCPTCLQNVNGDYKKNITRRLDEEILKHKKEISALENDKEKTIEEIGLIKKDISEIKKQIETFILSRIQLRDIKEKEEKLKELETQKDFNLKDMDLLAEQIKRLKEASSSLKKYEKIYEEKKTTLQEIEKKEKEKELEFTGTKKEIELLLFRIEELEQEIRKKEIIKDNLFKLAELEDWLSSSFLSLISLTERNIMLKLREDFSKLFNEWFNMLVPEIFTVRLDEDFTPIIEQQDFSLSYSFLSGGERTAVALAYRLALNQVINSLLSRIKTRDLVILDEPTDGFSEQQLDKMRDVLQELNAKQLIIVSHEAKIESFVENIIKFTKEDGITKVE